MSELINTRCQQGKLLHSSLHTTSIYGDKLQSAKNEHASQLAQLFGIK